MNTRDDKLQYINELSFFKLFFTHELIDMICLYTNRYAPAISHHKPSLFKSWIVLPKMRCIVTSVSCFTWLLLIYPDLICIKVTHPCPTQNKSPIHKSYLHKVDTKSHPSPHCPLCTTHTTHTISSTAPTYAPHCHLWICGQTLLARWRYELTGGPKAG